MKNVPLENTTPNTITPSADSSLDDGELHYYCLAFMFADTGHGTIYVGLTDVKVTAEVIKQCKKNMKKHHPTADPDLATLISVSYLGLMKPSEFDPENCPRELLE